MHSLSSNPANIRPYAQKESAKALGAKFDFDHKTWYIPIGLDSSPFERWMPSGVKAVTEINLFDTELPLMDQPSPQDQQYLTLSGILNKVAGVLTRV